MAYGVRKQPLYDQLVDILTEKIEHEYRPGDLMPSERELSERYGLSRTTVRLALQELERLGLVVRQHGRGTFVADRSAQTTNLMQTYSFTEQMRELGRVPETTILEFAEIEADKNLAEHMGTKIGDRIFKLKRLRSADGMPPHGGAYVLACAQVHVAQAPAAGEQIALRDYRERLSREDPRCRGGVFRKHCPPGRCASFEHWRECAGA